MARALVCTGNDKPNTWQPTNCVRPPCWMIALESDGVTENQLSVNTTVLALRLVG